MDFLLNKIDKQVDNHRSLDQNINALKRKLEELNGLKEDIKSRMSTELQPRKKLKKEIHIWLDNVERINGEIQSLYRRIGESCALRRVFHAEDVLKKIKEVEEHIQKGKFHEGLVVENTQWIGQVLSTTTLSGEAPKAFMEEIWQYLMDDEVRKIGVYGIGGVGKTSIMKLINNQLLKETEKFDIVIWITVSKDISIAKLQKDIASKIDVSFYGDEDEVTKAGMLFEALSRKSRFVMILDDIWERVSLERVGIPEPSTGSKLVLTTRSFDVCRQLGCREIRIKPLGEKEAWNLFLEKAGQDIINVPGLEPIARSIAQRCAGLPLGIITIASSMKGIYDLSEWRNALKELSVHIKSVNGLEDEVFQQLRFSYDRLKDQKLQHCFLSCALYPEDYEITEVDHIQHWIAEGLVEEMDTRQTEFDRGHAIMNKLINNCLLEVVTETNNGRSVKMHDLIRDMALRITSGTPRFLVKAGMRLTEPPDVQEWSKDLEKVSLMWNLELGVLYPLHKSPPRCPMLTTLLLSNCCIRRFSKGFFKHMNGLKILDLSENPIKRLPNSVSNLKNLISLLLRDCQSLERVPSLSKLRALKELDLEGTNIKEVPHGMENLLSLKYLNLNGTRNLNEIPDGILSKLSCLQYLIIGYTLVKGEEFSGLKKLEYFEGIFCDLQTLNMYVQALPDRDDPLVPLEYIISVGARAWMMDYYTRRYIELIGCNITNKIMLPRDIAELGIMECNLKDSLFSRCFLVSLSTFSSLQFLSIHNCKNMKKLFSPNCVPPNLQGLYVWMCDQLEEIMASELEWEESGMDAVEFHLPQLQRLQLGSLPKLKSICSVNGVIVCDSLNHIRVSDCPKLRRMPFKLPQLDNVQPCQSQSPSPRLSFTIYIRPREWWESVEWDHPDAKSLLEPFLAF